MQNWKKGYVFDHIDRFWNGHDTQIKKNACKNAYLGAIFIPEKYMFRVCFESPFTRMISNLKYKWPPGHSANSQALPNSAKCTKVKWRCQKSTQMLKGHWTSSTSCPTFFQKKLGFLYIRSVGMSKDCMPSFTFSIDLLLKKYEYF